MKLQVCNVMAALAVAGAWVPAVAGEKECAKECAAKTAASAGECASCPVSVAMGKLPKMTYVVAGEEICCPESAAQAAAEGKEVKYVVAGKEFCCEAEAKTAHVAAVEEFVAGFAQVKSCETSGKHFVAGTGYDCDQHAAAVAKTAQEAMEKVALHFVVAGKEFCCGTMAGNASKELNSPVEYVIGEEKTQCATTARLNLALAKYKAAVLAVAQAESGEKPEVAGVAPQG